MTGKFWWFQERWGRNPALEEELAVYHELACDTPLFDELATLHDWYWGTPVDLTPEEFAEVGRTREYKGLPICLLDRNNYRIEFTNFEAVWEAAETAIVSIIVDNFQSYIPDVPGLFDRESTMPNLDLIFEVYEPKLLEFLKVGMVWKTVIYDDVSNHWFDKGGEWALKKPF